MTPAGDIDGSLVPAADGLPGRNSGPWALDKLRVLSRYSEIFTSAMQKKFPKGPVFVDLMAGPGRCVDTKTIGSPEFKGSTILALELPRPFARVVAVESNPACAEALRARVAQVPRAAMARVLSADCNTAKVIGHLREYMQDALTLMFIDLIGTEVTMETIRTLTFRRAVDLLITWPVMDITRNQSQFSEQPERWTNFFGTTAWADVSQTGPLFRVRNYQRLYVRQLEALGFVHHRWLPGIKNRQGGVLYRPLFTSRHELAVKFLDAATRPQVGRLF